MKLLEFDYFLPRELIAQYPLKKRDNSRLLIFNRQNKEILHCNFFNIVDYFSKGDVLVLNDTKVILARAFGITKDSNQKIEILLTRKIDSRRFEALIKPLKKIRINQEVVLDNNGYSFKIVDFKRRLIEFNIDNIEKKLDKLGHVPLPPYIKRIDTKEDRIFYQTIYARKEGSIAAPTAGLHFTAQLLKEIERKGVAISYLTLHIGYGTFTSIKTDDIKNHKMHEEYVCIYRETIDKIRQAKDCGKKIFAVGTTTTRALEANSSLILDKRFNAMIEGYTDLFIYPPYEFKIVDALVTNFHLPRSSLYILVCAFANLDDIKHIYQQAIRHRYRFYSYGDAMLIL